METKLWLKQETHWIQNVKVKYHKMENFEWIMMIDIKEISTKINAIIMRKEIKRNMQITSDEYMEMQISIYAISVKSCSIFSTAKFIEDEIGIFD